MYYNLINVLLILINLFICFTYGPHSAFPPLPPLLLPPLVHCPLYWLRKGQVFHGKAYYIKLLLRLSTSHCSIQAGPSNLVGGKVFQEPVKATRTDLLPLPGVLQTHQATQLSHIWQEGLGPIQFHPGILVTGSDSEFPWARQAVSVGFPVKSLIPWLL